VSPELPTYEQELLFVKNSEAKIRWGEEFENFILEKTTNRLLWAWGFRVLKSMELNIGIWLSPDDQGKWYATEVYSTLMAWARENTNYDYIRHSLNPKNTGSRKLAEKFGWVLQDTKTERGHDIYHIPL
jgi:[ribosomal protein S5]-alanine N-acetyltransferase